MTPTDVLELAALDQAWMEAEERRDIFQRLAGLSGRDLGVILFARPEIGPMLRKACAIVGLECERRIRERTENAD